MNLEARVESIEAIERIAERLVADMSVPGESARGVAACVHVVAILESARKARLLLRSGTSGVLTSVRDSTPEPEVIPVSGTSSKP